jgi:subtilisin family serine protease
VAISIPRDFVEQILLGRFDNRRQLQDSPILTDVWIAFATQPDAAIELLITPSTRVSAGRLAFAIHDRLQRPPGDGADVAPLQGVVAAKLYFAEVLRIVVPMTEWWNTERVRSQLKSLDSEYAVAKRLNEAIDLIVDLGEHAQTSAQESKAVDMLPAFDRLISLAGLILWARDQSRDVTAKDPLATALNTKSPGEIFVILDTLFEFIKAGEKKREGKQKDHQEPLVRLVSLNRTATPAVARSVPVVKADAARGLFDVNCSEIAWAIVDSGIKGDHAAFRHPKTKACRVIASFDFTNIRKIVSLDNLRILDKVTPDKKAKEDRLGQLLPDNLRRRPTPAQAVKLLQSLAEDARNKRPVDWEFVRPFVEINPETTPEASDHGTHVAGILGACGEKRNLDDVPEWERDDYVNGMCPEIQLYDFRVLAPGAKQTEFAIIAALQFIRHLNARTEHMAVHGANLSLSIPHDVRNYGCGRTPVCLECERLVESGVVVVAAAGNLGYHSYATKEGGSYEGYAAFSITDPGNADGVITVGATHRNSPHTYGVSFFSSRGPTGDGRLKPDLVAPGERIRAPFRERWDDLDGTSMAAPHVSGAAAMLMARYSELIGQPRRIKQILCNSATDLGRERSFQGYGMLDVLRAFQSI